MEKLNGWKRLFLSFSLTTGSGTILYLFTLNSKKTKLNSIGWRKDVC